jgi:hypothetical protein
VNGPNGVTTVSVRGYDPTAAAIAQNRAAAQNEAMISNVVEIGQQNLANLERSVIKDNTLLPENGTVGNCNSLHRVGATLRITP